MIDSSIMSEELLTTQQAADKIGISRARIIGLIKEGKILANKVGRDWVIHKEDLAKFQRKQPGSFRIPADVINEIRRRADLGENREQLSQEYKISIATLYRVIRKR
jgi:excisionase family DNA binding protein